MTAFSIDVPQADLDDLRARLRATRWPDVLPLADDDDTRGINPAVLSDFVEYWAESFDWRATEARLNTFEHLMIDGVHVLRAGTPGATPLLLLHGWPDSFLRFERAIPLLADRFELIIPSIPGYGFSDRPTGESGPDLVADRFVRVLTELGYERFGVHGADIGAHIADQLAVRHPERLIGLHLGNIVMSRMRLIDEDDLTVEDRAWISAAEQWEVPEGGYMHLQRTKPQTIAVSLNDSPAGLAAWILEKFDSWSDHDNEAFGIYDVFTRDELAANLTLYWVTQTAGSAARYYYDAIRTRIPDGAVTVPTGVTQFPKDLIHAPRRSAERWYPIVHWHDVDHGGHFGPWEQPEAWAADVTAFFDRLEAPANRATATKVSSVIRTSDTGN